MSTIAIVVPPFIGHIHPTLSMGKELIARGHRVCWLSPYDNIAHIIPRGGTCIRLKTSYPLMDIGFGMQSLQCLYEQILVPLNAAMYDELKTHICNGDYDIIITDHQAFAGAMVAHVHNIPFITSVTAPAAIEKSESFPEVMNFENEQIIRLQQHLGIHVPYALVCSSPLTIVYTTREFLQNTNFPSSYKFVGPSIRGRDEQAVSIKLPEEPKPKILITLGSLLKYNIDFIDKVVDAFKDDYYSIILVADPSLKQKWPDNFFVYPYIPQLAVLEKVQAVICHAGYNTVCEALSFGLPIVAIPIVNDQSYVATKVKDSGVGIRLKYKRLKSEHLVQSLNELLLNPCYVRAAARIKESFEKAGGTSQAVDFIEQFVGEHAHGLDALNKKNITLHKT